MIMIMIKELLLYRISSGLVGALHTLKLKEKLDKTLYIVYAKISSNKNVFKSVSNVSTEFAVLSEHGRSFQRHGLKIFLCLKIIVAKVVGYNDKT